jgi:hypothetical protein
LVFAQDLDQLLGGAKRGDPAKTQVCRWVGSQQLVFGLESF